MKDCATRHDAYKTARHFLHRILNSAVTIRRHQLQNLQQHRGAKNDKAHKGDLPRIRQAEQRAENRKRGEMFKTG
jgi:radical SAM superfamily enzyme with C-terminal helix-hairpin-helix motif